MQKHQFVIQKLIWTATSTVVRFCRFVLVLLLGGDTCVRCGKVSGVYPLCSACLAVFTSSWTALLDDTAPRCRLCGKPLLSEISYCSACRTAPVLRNVDAVFPLHTYQLWKKSLLFAWKTENRRTLSPVFAKMLFCALQQMELAYGCALPIVPVPPRQGKIRLRGWDQIDELCRVLHYQYGCTILPLLKRNSVIQQKKLDRTKRLNGAEAAYALATPHRLQRVCKRGIPRAVVILDDVMTTGATIDSCATQLKRLGVQRVYALTLFVVD